MRRTLYATLRLCQRVFAMEKLAAITPEMAAGLELAIAAAGSRYRLALDLGINRSSISRWKAVPVGHCGQIERLYRDKGATRAALRPDLFGEGE